MKALVLAGGQGSRLKALVSDRPKPMALVNNQPFLDYLVNELKKYDIREIIFALCYLPKVIRDHFGDGKRHGIFAHYLIEPQAGLGTAGAVKLAEEFLKQEPFLVLNGDTFFPINYSRFIEFHRQKGGIAAIGLSTVADISSYGSVDLASDDQILAFREKTVDFRGPGLVNGGAYIFEPDIFDFIPARTKLSIEHDLFPKLIESGQNLFGYRTDLTHFDIGTPAGLRKTAAYLKDVANLVIRSRAPVRLAFGGGGTDLEPYISERGGVVLNATINRYVYATLQLRSDRKVRIIAADYKQSSIYDDIKDLHNNSEINLINAVVKRMEIDYGFELFVRSDVPPNTGLGASSSLAVAVIGLFNHFRGHNKLTLHQIAELAFLIETADLKNFGGRQDQYAAAFGGFNLYEFQGGDFVKVNRLEVPEWIKAELEKNILLVYLKQRATASGLMQKAWMGKGKSVEELDELKNLAYESYHALLRKDLNTFGELLHAAWELKKARNPAVTNPQIDRLYELALQNGALGGRIAGSGGGGHLILYCTPNTEQEVGRVLRNEGAEIIDFSFVDKGLLVWEVE